MFIAIIFLVVGLLTLVKGADWLVDGASSLAHRWGISAIVIGLTIVAFGTSAPELIVNLVASLNGNTEIAIGNIVGSNIANILLILGITGCITPLTVKKNTVWKEIPFSLLAVFLLAVMASDIAITGRTSNFLDRIDGIVLIAFFVIFLYYTYGISKAEGEADQIEGKPLVSSWVKVLGGLFLLVVGGKSAVTGAESIAVAMGLSQRVIALTVVAVGTSLPELLTSVVAAYKKQIDIAVGNIVGSNIFNVFWILGVSSIIRPLPFSSANLLDAWVAIGASLLLFITMFVGRRHTLQYWQSFSFIIIYAGYLFFVIANP